MRYEKDHKEQTRQRIVETAARRFREHGIEAEGVKSLMSAAGLTNGAFYNHFASKEDLAREAITAAANDRVARLRYWIDWARASPACSGVTSPQLIATTPAGAARPPFSPRRWPGIRRSCAAPTPRA